MPPGGRGKLKVGTIYADIEVDSKDLGGGIARANTFIAAMKKELRTLDDQLNGNLIHQIQYNKATAELKAELAKIQPALQAAYAAYEKVGTTQERLIADGRLFVDRFGKNANRMQQAVVATSYVFNDFFGSTGGWGQKLNAIANNMPMLFDGLAKLESLSRYSGELMGFGLALGAIVPIIGLIITNWDHLSATISDWTGLSVSSLKTVKTEMENLRKKVEDLSNQKGQISLDTNQLYDAEKRLKQLEEGEKQAKEFAESQTKGEAAYGGKVDEILKDIPERAHLESRIAETFVPEVVASPEVQAARKEMERQKKKVDEMFKFSPESFVKTGGGMSSLILKASDTAIGIGMDLFQKGPVASAGKAEAQYFEAIRAARQTGPGSKAAAKFGELLNIAKTGSGEEQANAVKRISDLLRGAGYATEADKMLAYNAGNALTKDEKDAKKKKEDDDLSEKKQRENERIASEKAAMLQEEFTTRRAQTGSFPSNQKVAEMLSKYGMVEGTGEAAERAPAVAENLKKQYRLDMQKLAAKEGIPIDEAPARFLELEAEKLERAEAAAQKRRLAASNKDQATREREQAESLRRSRKTIQKEIPGYDRLTEDFVTAGMLGGMSVESMKEYIADELQVATDGKINFVDAQNIAEGRVDTVRQRIANRAMGMDEEIRPWRSEIYDVSQLATRIQQGVGQGQESKSDRELKTIREILQKQNSEGILRLQIRQ